MDNEPDKKRVEYVQGPPKTGKTEGVLRQAHNYAGHGWIVLFVSCDDTIESLHKKMEDIGIAPSDLVTFVAVEKKPGFIKEVIELCQKRHPDILVLDGGQPGVTDLKELSAAAKILNMLVIVTQRPSGFLK